MLLNSISQQATFSHNNLVRADDSIVINVVTKRAVDSIAISFVTKFNHFPFLISDVSNKPNGIVANFSKVSTSGYKCSPWIGISERDEACRVPDCNSDPRV